MKPYQRIEKFFRIINKNKQTNKQISFCSKLENISETSICQFLFFLDFDPLKKWETCWIYKLAFISLGNKKETPKCKFPNFPRIRKFWKHEVVLYAAKKLLGYSYEGFHIWEDTWKLMSHGLKFWKNPTFFIFCNILKYS